jgi:hypothetical protein
MTKPRKNNRLGLISSACSLALLFICMLTASSAMAIGTYSPSVRCPAINLDDDYKVKVDGQCATQTATCDDCICVQELKAKQEAVILAKKTAADMSGWGALHDRVSKASETIQLTSWCKVNIATNPIFTTIMNLIDTIGAIADWGGIFSAVVIAIYTAIKNYIITTIENAICAAVAAALTAVLNAICISIPQFNITIPDFSFNFGAGTPCATPLATITAVPQPVPPLYYSSIPKITYRGKLHVIQ